MKRASFSPSRFNFALAPQPFRLLRVLKTMGLSIAIGVLSVSSVAAQTTWGGGGIGNDWFTAGNWNAGVPNASTTVIFNSNATVDFSANAFAQQLQVNSGTVTFNGAGGQTLSVQDGFIFDPGDLTLNNLAVEFGTFGAAPILQQISGDVLLDNGSSLTNLAGFYHLGNGNNQTATLTIEGGSTASTNQLRVGISEGTGTVNVIDGSLTATGLSIADAENGGFDATGTVNIENNGSVTVTGDTIIWGDGTSDGTLNLNGGTLTTGSFENNTGGTFNFNDGTLEVVGGTFDPGSGTYSIDGQTATDTPHLVINGATVDIGANILNVGDANRGSLTIQNGGMVENGNVAIGSMVGSTGVATVSGAGSTWDSANLFVGLNGNGSLNILDGGSVTNFSGFISDGIATVSGSGSTWNNTDILAVGFGGTGTLNIQDGGAVSNTIGAIGSLSNGSTGIVNVSGVGSTWTNSSPLTVGDLGFGSLNIQDGGRVSNTTGLIGDEAGSTGIATVSGIGSTWINSGDLIVGNAGYGTLNIQDGGAVSSLFGTIGADAGSTGIVTVSGTGSTWTNTGDLRVGNAGFGTLNIQNGGTVSSQIGYIGFLSGSTGNVTVSGNGSTWTNTNGLNVGDSGFGTLNIEDGGAVSNSSGFIGTYAGSTGIVNVSGLGSTWTNTAFLVVGTSGFGTLNIQDGGAVSSSIGMIGRLADSTGIVNVSGSGSTWTNTGDLDVGGAGFGTLNIQDGGAVSSSIGIIGRGPVSTGIVNVSGTGSTWTNTGELYVGGDNSGASGTGILTIENGGRVNVGGSGTINWDDSSIVLNQGTLNTDALTNHGDITLGNQSLARINGSTLANNGQISGSGRISSTLTNNAGGEISTTTGDRLRFTGTGTNMNAGSFINSGGHIEFDDAVTNQVTGIISGRGQFTADGGWTNNGQMLFSGGFTDVHGTVTNPDGALIVTAGNSITTFHDLVTVADGDDVVVDSGSGLVFLGDLDLTTGMIGALGSSVFINAGLSGGSSPGTVGFGGDLTMGANSDTLIELGGLGDSDFDRLMIGGDARLNGELSVAMWNGFALGADMEFVFASIAGDLTGMFRNLGEGDRVGTYNGYDLFISYQRGDGNDVALFSGPSAVPEPATVIMFATAIGLLACPRRRRR